MPPWVDPSVLEDFGLGPQDRAAWLASGLPEDAFEDSLMDRVARRPSGEPPARRTVQRRRSRK